MKSRDEWTVLLRSTICPRQGIQFVAGFKPTGAAKNKKKARCLTIAGFSVSGMEGGTGRGTFKKPKKQVPESFWNCSVVQKLRFESVEPANSGVTGCLP